MQVLDGIRFHRDERLLVGPEGMDDAGIFRLRDDLALVQTVDFFPPMVDDAYLFGRIAAVNSLSDVYAMGGRPLTALQVVGFPKDQVPLSVLHEILRGGADVLAEAECSVVGGHSVVDSEIKYGLCVTGEVHPDKVVENKGARVGDVLVLTKELGLGVANTAHKKEKADPALVEQAGRVMGRLNRAAAEAMVEVGVHAATDITGFGLMGHAAEIARASQVTLHLDAARMPLLPGVVELSRRGLLSGGSARTRDFLEGQYACGEGVDRALQDVLFDAETSGGLLMAVAPELADALEEALERRGEPAHRIGVAAPREDVWIRLS